MSSSRLPYHMCGWGRQAERRTPWDGGRATARDRRSGAPDHRGVDTAAKCLEGTGLRRRTPEPGHGDAKRRWTCATRAAPAHYRVHMLLAPGHDNRACAMGLRELGAPGGRSRNYRCPTLFVKYRRRPDVRTQRTPKHVERDASRRERARHMEHTACARSADGSNPNFPN